MDQGFDTSDVERVDVRGLEQALARLEAENTRLRHALQAEAMAHAGTRRTLDTLQARLAHSGHPCTRYHGGP